MKILLCTPNIVGFLSAVYAAYYTEKDADTVSSDANRPSLLDTSVVVTENLEFARKVMDGVLKKGGRLAWNEISDTYRNEKPTKEDVLFRYLRLFFQHGRATSEMLANPAVIAFNDLLGQVRHEIHRLHGFVRFHEMSNGAYYGYYTSDHDVLERVTPHFALTYNTQPFVLHDYKRQKMAVYDGTRTHYLDAPETLSIELSEQEQLFQTLWKNYHKDVSIKERENYRLQRAFLPKKYRHFMDEFF